MDVFGLFVILLSAFIWAVFFKCNEKLKSYPMLTKFFWQFIIVIFIFVIFIGDIQIEGVKAMSATGWGYMLIMTFIVTVGGYGFAYLSTKKAGATITATTDFIEPVVGVILAMIIFGETVTWLQVFGWLLIFSSIFSIGWVRKLYS